MAALTLNCWLTGVYAAAIHATIPTDLVSMPRRLTVDASSLQRLSNLLSLTYFQLCQLHQEEKPKGTRNFNKLGKKQTKTKTYNGYVRNFLWYHAINYITIICREC